MINIMITAKKDSKHFVLLVIILTTAQCVGNSLGKKTQKQQIFNVFFLFYHIYEM